jgi:hypothetical protein
MKEAPAVFCRWKEKRFSEVVKLFKISFAGRVERLERSWPLWNDLAPEKVATIWIFFERPMPATVARKLLAPLLTRKVERIHQLRLDSQDGKGGFGNLIALPLQKCPRSQHQTEFFEQEAPAVSQTSGSTFVVAKNDPSRIGAADSRSAEAG